MPDIIAEVTLPSQGKLYDKEIQWRNQLRAPKLKDRGFGDTTRPLELQAKILDKTLEKPLGMSVYDLHTADFTYLNMKQRQLTKGSAPYNITVTCKNCGATHTVNVKFEELEIKPLEGPLDLTYTTADGNVLELNYITPRILDACKDAAIDYRNEYPEADLSDADLQVQELLRLVIRTIDGEKYAAARKTNFINEMYQFDIDNIVAKLNKIDFGVQFDQTMTCSRCKRKILYTVPIS